MHSRLLNIYYCRIVMAFGLLLTMPSALNIHNECLPQTKYMKFMNHVQVTPSDVGFAFFLTHEHKQTIQFVEYSYTVTVTVLMTVF